ncbi:uncharacterized protein LOC105801142 [Gossypium raimondii]|uniref:uncharacterized protein LOC105801142 n=1 Tax=Gossypium raimondii TaxID=29730 RepID=UPI00063AAF6C|nr:uncharacterized protein LOC105801142 [Gossypium raimondii]
MEDFSDMLEEQALVDVKTTNAWFTWSNNREGPNLVKERLDRFLISDDLVEKLPFMNTRVVQQSKSDHDSVLLNTEARNIIKRIWDDKNSDMMNKMENVRKELGPWQYGRYRRMKYDINRLEKKIGKIMDGPISMGSLNLLKTTRDHLGKLYDAEEKYWAQRACNQWLREGDRNTRYFHVRVTGRKKKNLIDKLKDVNSVWYEDKNEISHIAWSYFHNPFKTSIRSNEDVDLVFVPKCMTNNMNC